VVSFPQGERPVEDPGLDGRVILRWIFRNWDRETWTGMIRLRVGISGGHL
jgi:hypothetical protein